MLPCVPRLQGTHMLRSKMREAPRATIAKEDWEVVGTRAGKPNLNQRELNGTRLMVHAGNCWQFFAVFCRFSLFPGKSQSLGSAAFRSFLQFFTVFLQFPLFSCASHWARTIKRPPTKKGGFASRLAKTGVLLWIHRVLQGAAQRGARFYFILMRFSGPFFLAAKWALATLKLAPPWRQPREAPLDEFGVFPWKKQEKFTKISDFHESGGFLWILLVVLRAACLQNETAPEKLLNRYEKRVWKTRKKDPKNDPKRDRKMFSPSQAA